MEKTLHLDQLLSLHHQRRTLCDISIKGKPGDYDFAFFVFKWLGFREKKKFGWKSDTISRWVISIHNIVEWKTDLHIIMSWAYIFYKIWNYAKAIVPGQIGEQMNNSKIRAFWIK